PRLFDGLLVAALEEARRFGRGLRDCDPPAVRCGSARRRSLPRKGHTAELIPRPPDHAIRAASSRASHDRLPAVPEDRFHFNATEVVGTALGSRKRADVVVTVARRR